MVQNEDNARMLAVSMILVVLLLMLLAMLNFGEKITDIFWFAFLLLALRLVLSFGRNLFHLSSLKLFDSSVFGVSSVTPSLGDMMLHLAAFFIFLSYCYKRKKYLISYFPLFSKSIFQGVIQLSLLTNFYTIFIINVLFKLIDNSNSLTFSVIQFYKFNI